jgi:hypothetical protein
LSLTVGRRLVNIIIEYLGQTFNLLNQKQRIELSTIDVKLITILQKGIEETKESFVRVSQLINLPGPSIFRTWQFPMNSKPGSPIKSNMRFQLFKLTISISSLEITVTVAKAWNSGKKVRLHLSTQKSILEFVINLDKVIEKAQA